MTGQPGLDPVEANIDVPTTGLAVDLEKVGGTAVNAAAAAAGGVPIADSNGTLLSFKQRVVAQGSPFSSVGAGAQTIFDLDVSNYDIVTVEITSGGSGAAGTFTESIDGTNYRGVSGFNVSVTVPSSPTNSTISAGTMFCYPVYGIRARFALSALTSGTFTVNVCLGTLATPIPAPYSTVVGPVANAATVSGNPIRIGAHAVAAGTPLTPVAAGQVADLVSDLNGRHVVTLADFTYTHISTSTDTNALKSGTGRLQGVTVGSKGTVASAVTIYDSLTAGSGTVIGIVDSLNLTGQFLYNCNFTTGLSIRTTGTAAPDVTVTWQ